MIVSKQIEKEIRILPKGSLVFVYDFAETYGYEAARKTLQRLCNKRELVRLAHGIYYLPKKDKLLGIIYPSTEQIAEAIAKRDKARIVPTGSYALYQLGLSTQIPMKVVYLTDGSARKIEIGKQKIEFRKTSPKNLASNHSLSNLIIQGLKELKENQVTEETIKKLKEVIVKSGETDTIKENIINAPVRIQKIIQQIISEIENE